MSALLPIADIAQMSWHVRFVPEADSLPSYWIYLGLILLSYVVLTHLMTTWCARRFGLS